MGREAPFKADAICDGCGATGAFDFMGDYACEACSTTTEEYWGPEFGDLEIWGMSGGAAPEGVAGLISVSSKDSEGVRWTCDYVRKGDWRRCATND